MLAEAIMVSNDAADSLDASDDAWPRVTEIEPMVPSGRRWLAWIASGSPPIAKQNRG